VCDLRVFLSGLAAYTQGLADFGAFFAETFSRFAALACFVWLVNARVCLL